MWVWGKLLLLRATCMTVVITANAMLDGCQVSAVHDLYNCPLLLHRSHTCQYTLCVPLRGGGGGYTAEHTPEVEGYLTCNILLRCKQPEYAANTRCAGAGVCEPVATSAANIFDNLTYTAAACSLSAHAPAAPVPAAAEAAAT
jgi:hypothetical protein